MCVNGKGLLKIYEKMGGKKTLWVHKNLLDVNISLLNYDHVIIIKSLAKGN